MPGACHAPLLRLSQTLRRDFDVQYKGRDIHTVHTKRSGVTLGEEYVWRVAAQWAHYTQEQFEELDGTRQSTVIALYSTAMQTEAVLSEAASKRTD